MLLLFVACGPPTPTPVPPAVTPALVIALDVLPDDPHGALVALHDPLPIDADRILELTGPDGVRRELQGGSARAGQTYWLPDEPWGAGIHRVERVFGEEDGATTFEVVGFGTDPSFPGVSAGDIWRLDSTSGVFLNPPGVGGIVQDQLETQNLSMEAVAVGDGTLDFRLVADFGDRACSAHSATATVDAAGLATWTSAEEDFPVGDGVGLASDLRLDFGFFDGAIGGARGHALVDFRASGLFTADDSVCVLLDVFGEDCAVCPDGVSACVDVTFQGVRLDPLDSAPFWAGEPLAPCGGPSTEDLQIQVPSFDCSCASGGNAGSGLLGVLALLLWRRRRP